jgi:hypothetical protein
MNIYLIYATNKEKYDWYDTYDSFCIVANDNEEVRKIASENPGYEGANTWLDSNNSNIELVGTYIGKETEPFILISSFNAA